MILTCRSSTRSYEQHQPTHPCCRRVKCATNQLLDFTMVLTPVKHARYVLITIILSTFFFRVHHHHYHHQSLNDEGRWGTTDDFATSFLHFSLFSTALWDLTNSRPVHCLMLSSTSSSVGLVFFPLSLCLARWFWPDLMNGKHDHTTAVCVSLPSLGDLHVVLLPAGSWHGLPRW